MRSWPRASRATRCFINGLLDITDNLVDGKVVHPDERGAPRWRRSVPGRRRRQGHGDVLRYRQRHFGRAWLLARRRVRLGRFARLRPQGAWASPPRARGNRSSATSARSAATARRRTSPASASATCPATCSATACCCRGTSGCWPRSTIAMSSSIPNPDAARSFAERERMFKLPRSSWDDYDKSLISQGRRRVSRAALKSIPVSPEVRAALGHRPTWTTT